MPPRRSDAPPPSTGPPPKASPFPVRGQRRRPSSSACSSISKPSSIRRAFFIRPRSVPRWYAPSAICSIAWALRSRMCAPGAESWPRFRDTVRAAEKRCHSSAPFLLLRWPQPMLASATGGEGLPMHMAWFQWGGAATAVVLALLTGAPLRAADDSGVRPVAEELGQRAAAAAPEAQQKGGLSDSAVRVLMTYAFSIIPETQHGADGKAVKVDKSDPKLFLIPAEDARRVIRAATRSAYAEACELVDLAQANYQALIKSEEAKKVWSEQQLMMITALHMFSASYFAGNAKITTAPDEASTTGSKGDAAAPEGGDQAAGGTDLTTPKRPPCPPEQKQKVMNSINAYVQAAQAPPPPGSPPPP